jgi:hypothetical protein
MLAGSAIGARAGVRCEASFKALQQLAVIIGCGVQPFEQAFNTDR